MTVKRVLALLTALGLAVGAPLALLHWGSLRAFVVLGPREWLLRPLTSGSLVALLTVAGWLAWATIAVSFGGELVELASHGSRKIRIPGARWCRPLVIALLASVMGVSSLTGVMTAADGTAGAVAASGATTAVIGGAGAMPTPVADSPYETDVPYGADPMPEDVATEDAAPVFDGYVVQTGDDLWTLALTHLGSGSRWPEIAALNPALAADPVRDLTPGSMLALPDTATPSPVVPHA
ncbi:MAG: LysM peptidoglycan-binding domain-containing protein, partial [Propionibacteriaceae bacterium]|nr:LysM peptidoglycan-binding domain-containing protein [Propionibacteriaceae bacterium]